jgi:hypothetical protein
MRALVMLPTVLMTTATATLQAPPEATRITTSP